MDVSITKDDLYNLVKKAIRVVLNEEKLDYFLREISPVSKEEMEDIEKLYGRPPEKKEVAYSEILEI